MLGKQNIFLIGPMGSGKTAVGKQLARLLRMPFVDSDSEIERRTGADIPLIFEKEGEAGFRQRESEVIDDLTRRESIVLSTGGGAILRADNRERLQARGTVVYLETSVTQQAERVREGQSRPLLAGSDPAAKLAELMAIRAPLYAETADLTVRTDNRRVRAVAEQILRQLRARPGEPNTYT
ncbi:MAG: shikimate kinase AroK [Steroidobacteraceae bacterium]